MLHMASVRGGYHRGANGGGSGYRRTARQACTLDRVDRHALPPWHVWCHVGDAFSITATSHDDLLDYTSGRWLFNDAAAKTEYIFMEYTRHEAQRRMAGAGRTGPRLHPAPACSPRVSAHADVLPRGGSLSHAPDPEKAAARAAIPLMEKDARFCVGPDTRQPMWRGRRSQRDADRVPYESADAALAAAARTEPAYLAPLRRPLVPSRRARRGTRTGTRRGRRPPTPTSRTCSAMRHLRIAPAHRRAVVSAPAIQIPSSAPSSIVVRRPSDAGWPARRGPGSTRPSCPCILPLPLLLLPPRRRARAPPGPRRSRSRLAAHDAAAPRRADALDEPGRTEAGSRGSAPVTAGAATTTAASSTRRRITTP